MTSALLKTIWAQAGQSHTHEHPKGERDQVEPQEQGPKRLYVKLDGVLAHPQIYKKLLER